MAQRRPVRYYRSGAAGAATPFVKPAKARRGVLSLALDFLIIAVLLAAIIYSLIVGSDPKVITNSEAYHPASIYHQAALSGFKGIKNRNKLTFDEKAVVTGLRRLFPEITSARAELPLVGHKPELRLEIATPSFILKSGGEQYILSSDGVAVAKRSDLPRVHDLPVISDQSGFKAVAGQQILAAGQIDFIGILIKQSLRAKVPINSLVLPAKAMELDVRTTDRNYYTKFYLDSEPLTQIGQFFAARHHFDKTHEQPKQYLDVRVPGKIYFK